MVTSRFHRRGLPSDATSGRGASVDRAGGDAETVTVAARFHGPPRSGNGGYVCGRGVPPATAAGDVLAVSRATWVEPRDPGAHT